MQFFDFEKQIYLFSLVYFLYVSRGCVNKEMEISTLRFEEKKYLAHFFLTSTIEIFFHALVLHPQGPIQTKS